MSVCQARLRYRRSVAALVLATLGACSDWQVQPVAPAELVNGSSPSRVKVHLHDGRRLVLRQPAVRADSVVGAADGPGVAVAEIDSIAVRRFSVPRTVGLTALIVGVPALLCSVGCDFGPGFRAQY
jgi:hypothetical protein